MRYERQAIHGIEFGFSVTDGIIVNPHDVGKPEFLKAIIRAAELYLVFERVAIFEEFGYYSDDTSVEIKYALEAVERVDYPPSEIVDNLRRGYNQYRDQVQAREDKIQLQISRKQKRSTKQGYVYLLQSPTNSYKIGRSQNPNDRLKTFSVKLPFEVEYIALIETTDMVGLERQLHERFSDQRINGEWFDLTDEHVEYIKGLAT